MPQKPLDSEYECGRLVARQQPSFLLHFEYLQSNLHRDFYYPKLTKYLGAKYKKNYSDMFETLNPHLDEAIRNAKRLLQNYPDGSAPSQCAPGISVYEIL